MWDKFKDKFNAHLNLDTPQFKGHVASGHQTGQLVYVWSSTLGERQTLCICHY